MPYFLRTVSGSDGLEKRNPLSILEGGATMVIAFGPMAAGAQGGSLG